MAQQHRKSSGNAQCIKIVESLYCGAVHLLQIIAPSEYDGALHTPLIFF